jgi:1-deoxy-D-xylulose-5-phosphate reductoisomerase
VNPPPKNIAVLGSTGSIGRSTLEVAAIHPGEMRVVALSAHSKIDQLLSQARALRPRWLVVTDEQSASRIARGDLPAGTELLVGQAGLRQVVQSPDVDVVVAAIVGSAGLESTWAAVEAGKTVALANKETLVVAGGLVMQLADRTGAKILPVDSEHSAVFQALACGRKQDVKRIILTASGGPFRNHTPEMLENVTVDDALAHPTWDMGPKVTIDSATMMNKALELIEARWLFDLPPEQIDVVVHPQSIVHSLVEYIDGSVIAQLSPPDMKLPIQYALTYPHRAASPADKFDWTQSQRLEFFPPDEDRFPALKLGREVAAAGGTAGVVLNAANEAAVAEFMAGRISFTSIAPACRSVLQSHSFDSNPTLDDLKKLDAWARSEISQWIYA